MAFRSSRIPRASLVSWNTSTMWMASPQLWHPGAVYRVKNCVWQSCLQKLTLRVEWLLCRCRGEGNGTPLQYSCLENPMGGGAWCAAVHGVAKSHSNERLHFHFSLSCTGEGNGNPLQCSCLENPRDGGAWWAAVYGVAQSWTRLKWLSSLACRCREDWCLARVSPPSSSESSIALWLITKTLELDSPKLISQLYFSLGKWCGSDYLSFGNFVFLIFKTCEY